MNTNQNKTPTVDVNQADFESQVLKSNQPVLVAFWAPWSRRCRGLDSVLGAVASACAGNVKVVKVNADDHPDLSLQYGIQSVPTLLYFLAGNLLDKVVGAASKEAILAKLRAVSRVGDSKSPAPQAAKNIDTVTREPKAATPPERYSAKRTRHHVNFFCEAPEAKSVRLVGDFNEWDPAATPMKQMPDGRWMASLELPHGHHRYLFIVDGTPTLDPKASGVARDDRNRPVSLIAVS
ncbi:MAG: thioredoxin domain-containing protein [Verrucomicrobia bacterium]|nr:hypothetical protein [Bryobacteraceae bacterium]MCZ7639609.1 thioredoxin domain-containing protein [Verrucomicrobiota bacterium]